VKTSSELRLAPGTVITGKWNRGRYRVERLLGEGANGKVYLVEQNRRLYAMKVGGDAVDLQSEINVLRSLASRRRRAEPYLMAVDDYVRDDGSEYPFYVMRYVRGSAVHEYLQREGADWFPLVGYHLLGKLAELHEAGYVFGDLKRENVLVGDYGRVELVDFGGATALGKSVRQFTELYDRGYWNAGSRTAEGTYDLFSYAVLCLHLFEGRRLLQLAQTALPQNRSPADLIRLTDGHPALKPFAGWLARALRGEFASAREGAAAWQLIMYGGGVKMNRKRTPAGWAAGLFACTMLALAAAIVWLMTEGVLPTGLS
jgi:Serine/threonine protein kinase